MSCCTFGVPVPACQLAVVQLLERLCLHSNRLQSLSMCVACLQEAMREAGFGGQEGRFSQGFCKSLQGFLDGQARASPPLCC